LSPDPAERFDVAPSSEWRPSPALLGAIARCLIGLTDTEAREAAAARDTQELQRAARGAQGGPQ
jgi:hypothetical protein